MSDAELAREWLHERPLVNEVSYVTAEALTALLACVRLEGAKAARAAMTTVPGGYSIFPVDNLIEALEQAARGSAAVERKVSDGND